MRQLMFLGRRLKPLKRSCQRSGRERKGVSQTIIRTDLKEGKDVTWASHLTTYHLQVMFVRLRQRPLKKAMTEEQQGGEGWSSLAYFHRT